MSHALQFFVLTVADWVNRHQEELIDYLREENRVLREQLGSRLASGGRHEVQAMPVSAATVMAGFEVSTEARPSDLVGLVLLLCLRAVLVNYACFGPHHSRNPPR